MCLKFCLLKIATTEFSDDIVCDVIKDLLWAIQSLEQFITDNYCIHVLQDEPSIVIITGIDQTMAFLNINDVTVISIITKREFTHNTSFIDYAKNQTHKNTNFKFKNRIFPFYFPKEHGH